MILALEGDADLRQAILDILESAGLDVLMAGNGREVLEALRDLRAPSLVLLDLKMPGMDGLEFRRNLLETLELSSVPLVLLGRGPSGEKQARTRGFGFLKKPFGEEDLLRIVARYCAD